MLNRKEAVPKIQKSSLEITPTLVLTTTTPQPTSADLPTETLVYKQQPDWQTYTDNVVGFSFQYPAENNKLANSVQIYNDYDGSSRREWLKKKFSGYQPYYMNWVIDGANALVAIEGNTGGSSGLLIAIPKNKTMIVFSASFVAWDPQTDKLPDLSFYKQILSTFRFIK